MIATVAALAAGGLAGTLGRAAVSAALNRPGVPYGTALVNLSGCFLIGALSAWTERRWPGAAGPRSLLLAGFCGAYTTFSTLIVELDGLARVSPARAGAYLAVSVAAGWALLRAGLALGSR